jgi:hypothetical protein
MDPDALRGVQVFVGISSSKKISLDSPECYPAAVVSGI